MRFERLQTTEAVTKYLCSQVMSFQEKLTGNTDAFSIKEKPTIPWILSKLLGSLGCQKTEGLWCIQLKSCDKQNPAKSLIWRQYSSKIHELMTACNNIGLLRYVLVENHDKLGTEKHREKQQQVAEGGILCFKLKGLEKVQLVFWMSLPNLDYSWKGDPIKLMLIKKKKPLLRYINGVKCSKNIILFCAVSILKYINCI